MNEHKAEKLYNGVTNVGDDLIQESGLELVPKRQKTTSWRWAAVAACLCLALVGTAFAASPALREMLAAALGGFAPYAQGQEGEAYVIDGMEFRVVSTLADDFTVRAYIEARDLEGDRLSQMGLNELGGAFGFVDVPRKDTGGPVGFGGSGKCLDYDEETKTALLVLTSWGQLMADDLSGSEVKLFSLNGDAALGRPEVWENIDGVNFPVEIVPMDSFTADAQVASALQAEEVRLSPLGLSIIFVDDEAWPQMTGMDVKAKLTDGTLVEAPWEGGQGSSGTYGTESSRKVLIWNFREPLEMERIDGIYIGESYFAVKGLFSTK